MKTFTVRELDRKPGTILDICDHEGEVRIRRRNGATYRLKREQTPKPIAELPDFGKRRRSLFSKQISQPQVIQVDKWIAGE